MPSSHSRAAIVAAVGFAAAAMLFGLQADAGPKTTSKAIPKGATVHMQGSSSFRINGGGLNETGTFNCTCTGNNPQGTCVVGRGGSSILCGASGSTCNGTCKLYTTTGGFTGGGAVAQ
jgi:hypothetical protein